MSDHLFHQTGSRRALTLRLALLGIVTLTAFGIFSLYLGARFVGLAGGDVVTKARLATLGDSLGVNASVKYRGLRVGMVVTVDPTKDKDGLFAANVIINEEHAKRIPKNVVARVLPGTLFGAEYVDLRDPTGLVTTSAMQGAHVADGVVIDADTSQESVRVMDTFNALHRVLAAVDPEATDVALSQLADALNGRGDDISRAIGQMAGIVDDYVAAEPAFYRDLDYLAANLKTLNQVEPGIADSLRNSIPVAETISDKSDRIRRLTTSSTQLARSVDVFLRAHGPTLARLLDELGPVYRAFVQGREAFEEILHLAPPVLQNGANAVDDGAIQMRSLFSGQQGSPYSADDCPRYENLKGANCR